MVVSVEHFGDTLTMPLIPMEKNYNHLVKMRINQKMRNVCEVCVCVRACVRVYCVVRV